MVIINFITSLKKIKGGPAKIVIDNTFELCKNDINAFICTKRSNKDFEIYKLIDNKIIDYNLFSLFFKIYCLKKKYPKMLFHIHGIWDIDIIVVYLILKFLKIEYIISTRGSLEPWCLKQSNIKKLIALKIYQLKILLNSKLIHSTSIQEYNNTLVLFEKYKIKYNNFAILPNGIHYKIYNSSNLKHSKNISENYILFMSRIDKKKGLDLLIESWYKIKNKDKINWKLFIAGDGDKKYIDYILSLLTRYNLNNDIIYLGPVYGDLKLELLYNAKYLVLPSHSENFGNVISESLSSGVPVVTTNNTPWEILNTYNAGFCIDLKYLQSTLESLFLISDDEYIQMKKNAQKLVSQNFDFDIVIKQYYEMYHWAIYGLRKPNFIC